MKNSLTKLKLNDVVREDLLLNLLLTYSTHKNSWLITLIVLKTNMFGNYVF